MASKTSGTVEIGRLKVNRALQARERLDEAAVEDYMEQLDGNPEALPPILVVDTGSELLVWDGFHRVEAAVRLGITHIPAVITTGTWDDALWLAVGANKSHGVRRSRADKRRAVALALEHPKFAAMSNRKLAEHVGVSAAFVDLIVKERKAAKDEPDAAEPGDDGETDAGEDGETGETPVERSMARAKATLSAVVQQVTAARAELAALIEAKDPAANFLSAAVLTDLKNALDGIKQAMPKAECPYCHGDGCRSCNGAGWVGRLFWNHAVPAELKGDA